MSLNDGASALLTALAQTSLAELAAVLFGVAYLLLAVRQHIACWYAALISTGISIYVFWNVSLLMESALNGFYVVMAFYGWYQWRYGPGADAASGLPITRWSGRQHAAAAIAIGAAALLSGYLLSGHSSAAYPYLDSFTTWASVLTTYMVAKKVLENWLYWLVIDAISIFLYWERGLTLYALLFVFYLVIAAVGFWQWHREWRAQ